MRLPTILRGAAAALALTTIALPAPASASRTQESIFEDEYQLLRLGDAERNRALDEITALGADTVRSLVQWDLVAPAPRAKRRPKGFGARNPAAYPAGGWDRLDDMVRGANARGLGVLLSPSSPGPAWASACKGSAKTRRSCKPKPSEYRAFVQALGTRYSGSYADENQGGGVLPRVSRWSFWNEPNQPGWLTPQYTSRNGRRVAFAAHHYRSLVRNAITGLRASGHGGDQLLLGETAPIGRTSGSLARRPIPPVEFIRELLCLKSNGRANRSGSCRRYKRLAVTGFAHHPYTRGGSQPPRTRVLPGEITITSSSRLKTLLSQGARARRIPRSLPIFYTEYGFQTTPPDPNFGVSLKEQARYINESDWIAYRDSRIRSVAQYKLIDETRVESFQTGLRFIDGGAKPAYDAYRLPIWVVRSGSKVRVYGQLRPAADGQAEQVEIQHRASSKAPFEPVQTVAVSSPKGHFLVSLPGRSGGSWRLVWSPTSGGPTLTSRVATAARR